MLLRIHQFFSLQKYAYACDKLNENKLSVKTQRILNINHYIRKKPLGFCCAVLSPIVTLTIGLSVLLSLRLRTWSVVNILNVNRLDSCNWSLIMPLVMFYLSKLSVTKFVGDRGMKLYETEIK